MPQLYLDEEEDFRIILPDHWEFHKLSDSIGFCGPDIDGVINVSKQAKSIQFDCEQILLMLSDTNILVEKTVHEKWGHSICHTKYYDERHWMAWLCRNDSNCILITYNSVKMPSNSELNVLNEIIQSIRLA